MDLSTPAGQRSDVQASFYIAAVSRFCVSVVVLWTGGTVYACDDRLRRLRFVDAHARPQASALHGSGPWKFPSAILISGRESLFTCHGTNKENYTIFFF